MSLIALGLAAAFSTAAPDPAAENEKDMRCVAIVALIGGDQEGEARQAMMAGLMYFVGRIDGRDPGYDLEANLTRLLSGSNAVAELETDRQRCADIMIRNGENLGRIGRSLQASGAES